MKAGSIALAVVLVLVVGLSGCGGGGGGDFFTASTQTAEFGPAIAASWFDLIYERVRAQSYSPPVAARLYGYLGITLYECLLPGMPGHQTLAGQLNGLVSLPGPDQTLEYDWPTVANTALKAVASALFTSQSQATIDAFAAQEAGWNTLRAAAVAPAAFARSIPFGQDIAAAIIAWAATDGYSVHDNCPYVPPAGPGLWVPTPPAMAPALQPCWGMLRTFVVTSGTACPPPAPHPYSTDPSSPFYLEAAEVYTTWQNLTAEQTGIANFWADGGGTGTPAGHWVRIVSQRVTDEQRDLGFAAEAFARVGLAVHDAFVCCWNVKYAHNVLRPITYIDAVIAAGWTPLLTTPPFPDYTSGHSTQSGAAATVLTAVFGNGPFVDSTKVAFGMPPRAFASLDDAAAEAALSRLYGGIHYRRANEQGLLSGQCIGNTINQNVQFVDD